MLLRTISSPLGDIILCAHKAALVGLWFEGQKHQLYKVDPSLPENEGDSEILDKARRWVEAYFAGQRPHWEYPIAPSGTQFQHRVWDALLRIPYGETVSYGQLAQGLGCGCARAVGSAVGKNPISLIIPCHRVLGAGGALTGYAGGTLRKEALLKLEGIYAD